MNVINVTDDIVIVVVRSYSVVCILLEVMSERSELNGIFDL